MAMTAAQKQKAYRLKQKKLVTVTRPEVTVTVDGNAPVKKMTMTPEGLRAVVPANYGLADCQCRNCGIVAANGGRVRLNHGVYKAGEENRVALPGDIDYVGGKGGRRFSSISTNVSNNSKVGSELLKHLQTHSVRELESEGYWVPAWKYKESGL